MATAELSLISTGCSNYPNQINYVLAFPSIFCGAFDVCASDINEKMKLAAAMALAALIPNEAVNDNNFMPAALDITLAPTAFAASG